MRGGLQASCTDDTKHTRASHVDAAAARRSGRTREGRSAHIEPCGPAHACVSEAPPAQTVPSWCLRLQGHLHEGLRLPVHGSPHHRTCSVHAPTAGLRGRAALHSGHGIQWCPASCGAQPEFSGEGKLWGPDPGETGLCGGSAHTHAGVHTATSKPP